MRLNLDPYATSAIVGRKAVALAIGRSLSRFVYHLSQVAIAEDSPHSHANSRGNTKKTQFVLAVNAIKSIYARSMNLSPGAPNVCRAVRKTLDEFWYRSCDEGFCEYVCDLRLNLKWARDQQIDLMHELVDAVVASPQRWLVEACQNDFQSEWPWCELGKKLDEGLCRPDFYRFHDMSTPTLPTTNWSAKNLQALIFSASKMHQGHNRTCSIDLSAGASTYSFREPGDVAPDELWWLDVEYCWEGVGLTNSQLEPLKRLRTDRHECSSGRNDLIQCVDSLFETAQFSTRQGEERLRVNVRDNAVELDGVSYPVDRQIAIFFSSLKDGESSFNQIKRRFPEEFAASDKLTRLVSRMPAALRKIVSHAKGQPVRLNL